MRLTGISDTYVLNNGVEIPCVAFGTYKAAEGDNVEILKRAIACGYRYFDTASFYGTETYLGQAVKASGIPRISLRSIKGRRIKKDLSWAGGESKRHSQGGVLYHVKDVEG